LKRRVIKNSGGSFGNGLEGWITGSSPTKLPVHLRI